MLGEILPEECRSEAGQLSFLPADRAEKYPSRPGELCDLKDALGGMKAAKNQMGNSW